MNLRGAASRGALAEKKLPREVRRRIEDSCCQVHPCLFDLSMEGREPKLFRANSAR